MFDIGWSELVVVAVVALIAIGPKELPGVLRMVGQWMGKARRMAFDFQGQLNEAMREAEMADIKKQFDDVSAAARDMSPTNLLTSLGKDASDAMKFDLPEAPSFDSPSSSSAPAESEVRIGLTELPPSEEAPSTFTEAEAHALMVEKPTDHPAAAPAPQTPSAAPDVKAS